jgi:hypothetical protein
MPGRPVTDAKVDSPMIPHWTARLTDNDVAGEDHLGVEGAAQGYQQYLVPGIITTTDHARYYSFYAWVLYRYIFAEDSSRLLSHFRGSYFRRHELAFIMGCYSHHKDRGVLGGLVGGGTNNSRARTIWCSSDPISLDTHYFGNDLGGFGQYYLTAMQALGLVAEPERPRWVYRLTERGKALAEAFESSICDTRYFRSLKRQRQLTTLRRRVAEEYGERACLCSEALAQGHDCDPLREAFFRFDQPGDSPHGRRRLTLGLILDLVGQSGDAPLRETMREALYLEQFDRDHAYAPSPRLLPWYHRWQLVQVRHSYTTALQAL